MTLKLNNTLERINSPKAAKICIFRCTSTWFNVWKWHFYSLHIMELTFRSTFKSKISMLRVLFDILSEEKKYFFEHPLNLIVSFIFFIYFSLLHRCLFSAATLYFTNKTSLVFVSFIFHSILIKKHLKVYYPGTF